MNPVIKYLKDHKGYARMKDMKASGIHTRAILKLIDEGEIVKVKPGLYRLADLQPDETSGLIEVCLAMPKAVICLASALAFHELTTFMPPSVNFAIPRSDKPIKLRYPPNNPFYFSEEQYGAGIEQHDAKTGHIRIYGPEKQFAVPFDFETGLAKILPLKDSRNIHAVGTGIYPPSVRESSRRKKKSLTNRPASVLARLKNLSGRDPLGLIFSLK